MGQGHPATVTSIVPLSPGSVVFYDSSPELIQMNVRTRFGHVNESSRGDSGRPMRSGRARDDGRAPCLKPTYSPSPVKTERRIVRNPRYDTA
jgi:hypothetical protein